MISAVIEGITAFIGLFSGIFIAVIHLFMLLSLIPSANLIAIVQLFGVIILIKKINFVGKVLKEIYHTLLYKRGMF